MSAQWIVELSNGETIHQANADSPDGLDWIALRSKLIETGDHIINMYLRFRSHKEHALPRNAEAYFFVNQCITISISKKIIEFYLIGHVVGDIIVVQRWKIPELLFIDLHIRKVSEVNPLCLIGVRE